MYNISQRAECLDEYALTSASEVTVSRESFKVKEAVSTVNIPGLAIRRCTRDELVPCTADIFLKINTLVTCKGTTEASAFCLVLHARWEV